MAGSASDDMVAASGSSAGGGLASVEDAQLVESSTEWRSADQVENGTPSTSPPFWDTDDDDDVGPKVSDLYGKFTWKIEKFSQINKKELRSNVFEVGSYKWYILIYPQGCDVCNQLSLFLCVANHDKLLPGWGHFAQFTIAVLNKDPKKHKYSDTLHRFWKKEHDWGWKKFMELSKMSDGFIDDDVLTIKAQVQVIRDKVHCPFRCLDRLYRRELIRVYVSSVEQTCRRYVEERREKLSKLVQDKVMWSSFRDFWLGIDQDVQRGMSRDTTASVLKLVVKHFFIEKEVTSTLVMDSLYSGLRALECQSKRTKVRVKLSKEKLLPPLVVIEGDMFVLADDVFRLLKRATSESLPNPPVPAKDDKYSQNRDKEEISGDEFTRDSIVHDEQRLTELGCRTLEIFVLAHIFSSRIEVAYREAVSLKRQEELIREEEKAVVAKNKLKAKHNALEKEKKAKKKQAKQKRCNHRSKDKVKYEKLDAIVTDDHLERDAHERSFDDPSPKEAQKVELDSCDVSTFEPTDGQYMVFQLHEESRYSTAHSLETPHIWETYTSDIHRTNEASINEMQNELVEKHSPASMDDNSSTCSTDSVPSVVLNGPYKGNLSADNKLNQASDRRKKQWNNDIQTSSILDAGHVLDVTGACRPGAPKSDGKFHSLKGRNERPDQHQEKVDTAMIQEKRSVDKDQVNGEPPQERRTMESSSASSNGRSLSSKQSSRISTAASNETPPKTAVQTVKSVSLCTKLPQVTTNVKSDAAKNSNEQTTTQMDKITPVPRPLSAPLMVGAKSFASLVPKKEALPQLSRTLSSVSQLVDEPLSSTAQTYEPQSYRNAIMGIKSAKGSFSSGFARPTSIASSQSFLSSSSTTQKPATNVTEHQASADHALSFRSSYQHLEATPHQHVADTTDGTTSQVEMTDEFPHIDIINDLLDEEHIAESLSSSYYRRGHHDPSTPDISFLNSAYNFDMFEPYYNEMSQMPYDSSGVPFHLMANSVPPSLDFLSYDNRQMPSSAVDMSMLNFGSSGYKYPEFWTSRWI